MTRSGLQVKQQQSSAKNDPSLYNAPELARQSRSHADRGKSGLHRAECQVTPGGHRYHVDVYGKCHRKYTAFPRKSKGEMVR